MSERMTANLTCDALHAALWLPVRKRPRNIILHPGRGRQYCAQDYRCPPKAHDLIASRVKKGDCYDNAAIEGWNHSLKVEAIQGQRFATRQEGKKLVCEYIEIYSNRKCLRAGLGYLSPEPFEQGHVA